MRHRAPWVLSLALLAGLGAVASAQEAPPASPAKQNSSWFPNLWPFGQPAAKKTPTGPPKTQPVIDTAAMQREREWAAYWRRCEVCQKLVDIAKGNQDPDLERRAEQLRERAFEIYLQRIALLPVGSGLSADEQTVTNHLSPGDSTGRLTGETASRPTGNAVSQATPREDER